MKKEKIKDVVAGIFSIIFIAAVFYLYFLEVFNSGAFAYIFQNDKFVTYEQIEHNSCHINSVTPTIILRLDDVRAYSRLTKPIVEEVIGRNLPITLAVIPMALEKDRDILNYLRQIKTNPLIEIAQHGKEHNESEINISEESLLQGYREIQSLIGVLPVTYIPPYNKISPESKEKVSYYFNIISGKDGVIKEGDNIAEIGQTISTYYYTTGEFVPIESIVSKCKESLDKTNLCVVTIHPQEYATDINSPLYLDKEKFERFKQTLDELQKVDAEFSRFNDVVTCS